MEKMESLKTKDVIITRKIEIALHGYEGDKFKETVNQLFNWQKTCFVSANLIATHHFIQEQAKQLFYFTDEIKVKLANIEKDEHGILNTSKANTTYRVLSKMFKGEIPMAIITTLNQNIVQSFNAEKKFYFSGERSLRNYKKTIPIPVCASDFLNITKGEHNNYYFTLYGISFRTNFGKDLSGNRLIWERSLEGEYKFCNSSIMIEKKPGKPLKFYLLAVFRFDKQVIKFKKNMEAQVRLDFNTPLIVSFGDKTFKIGDREEFLHRRIGIQQGLKRAQTAATFNKGGKGIHKKTASIDRYKKAEVDYVTSRIHAYTAKLIDLCLKFGAGKIVLTNLDDAKTETKEETPMGEFLLRNWSYFGLTEKIKYKANKFNIEVEVSSEKKEQK